MPEKEEPQNCQPAPLDNASDAASAPALKRLETFQRRATATVGDLSCEVARQLKCLEMLAAAAAQGCFRDYKEGVGFLLEAVVEKTKAALFPGLAEIIGAQEARDSLNYRRPGARDQRREG